MRITSLILTICLLALCFTGCGGAVEKTDIAATTLPVYQFTSMLVEDTGLTVTRLVTESVSCLHDYSLNVRQVKAAESAQLIVINGAGLEEFMEDILHQKPVAVQRRHQLVVDGILHKLQKCRIGKTGKIRKLRFGFRE